MEAASAFLDAGVRMIGRGNGNGAHAAKEKFSRSAPARTSSFGPAAMEEEGADIDPLEHEGGVWKVRRRRRRDHVCDSVYSR